MHYLISLLEHTKNSFNKFVKNEVFNKFLERAPGYISTYAFLAIGDYTIAYYLISLFAEQLSALLVYQHQYFLGRSPSNVLCSRRLDLVQKTNVGPKFRRY